jgi:hypothetical protein
LYRWGELSDATLALIPQDCPAEDFPAALEAFHRAAELELAAAGGPVP